MYPSVERGRIPCKGYTHVHVYILRSQAKQYLHKYIRIHTATRSVVGRQKRAGECSSPLTSPSPTPTTTSSPVALWNKSLLQMHRVASLALALCQNRPRSLAGLAIYYASEHAHAHAADDIPGSQLSSSRNEHVSNQFGVRASGLRVSAVAAVAAAAPSESKGTSSSAI